MDTIKTAKQCYIKHHGTEPENDGYNYQQEWQERAFIYATDKSVAEAYIKEQRIIRAIIWSFGLIAFAMLIIILLAVFGEVSLYQLSPRLQYMS